MVTTLPSFTFKIFLKKRQWTTHLLHGNGRPYGALAFEDDVERVPQLTVANDHRVLGQGRILQPVAHLVHFLGLELSLFKKADVAEQRSHGPQFKGASLLGRLRQDGLDDRELRLCVDHGDSWFAELARKVASQLAQHAC